MTGLERFIIDVDRIESGEVTSAVVFIVVPRSLD